MTITAEPTGNLATEALNLRHLLKHPGEAAREPEHMDADAVATLQTQQLAIAVRPVWEQPTSEVEPAAIQSLTCARVRDVLRALERALAIAQLLRWETDQQGRCPGMVVVA